jgi:copper(I)-binding protein
MRAFSSCLQRRSVLRLALSSAASACGLGLISSARACDFSTNTLRVNHPWTRASADDAISAIVCMHFDQVQEDDRLIGVETMVAAGAEIGGVGARKDVDVVIPKGQTVYLSESGSYLRLLGLKMPLEVGRAYPMLLTFEKGGSLMTDLNVSYARFL